MISEFSLRPHPQNKKATYLFIAFMLGGAALTVLYFLMSGKPFYGFIGLGAMIFIIGAIFMYTRYMAAQYIYDVTVQGQTPMFIVRHKMGKRETTMCRVCLSGIISVEKQSREERRAHKTPRDHARYNYSPSLDPMESYLIISRSRYEKAEIIIEANEEFAAALMRSAELARAEYAEDDEEE